MMNDSEVRRLIGALYGGARLAQDGDHAPLVDLDAEQAEALNFAHGAALALEVVLGDRSVDDLNAQILDPLYTLVPKAGKNSTPPYTYTVRLAIGETNSVGKTVWEEVYTWDTYSSACTAKDVAMNVSTDFPHLMFRDGQELPWRITVQAGNYANHLDERLYTLVAPPAVLESHGVKL